MSSHVTCHDTETERWREGRTRGREGHRESSIYLSITLCSILFCSVLFNSFHGGASTGLGPSEEKARRGEVR